MCAHSLFSNNSQVKGSHLDLKFCNAIDEADSRLEVYILSGYDSEMLLVLRSLMAANSYLLVIQ